MENKQLNPFEIKAELASLMSKLKGVQNLNDYQLHFKTLDNQEDKSIIVKLLFKELATIKDNAPIVKYLLIRYCDEAVLTEKLWGIIKNQMTPNLTKIIALDILRDVTTDWSYENGEDYLENPNDLIDEDTKRLLTAAIINPEVQIDFLDFLNSLNDNDRLTLVSSLAQDYEKDELANILVPVFLSNPSSEVGKKALELLGTSKSQLAYHALNSAKDFVTEDILFNLKKSISTLKLGGIREDNSHEFYKKLLSDSVPYRFCATYPDGMGNIALIFSRRRKGGTIQFVATVINDYCGIKDCFGFNEISKFECDTIIERFYKQEKVVEIPPVLMKKLLSDAEMVSKKAPKWQIPYEYICWKNLLADIDCGEFEIYQELESKLAPVKLDDKTFEELIQMSIFDYWFLSADYSDEYELFLQTLNTKLSADINFDIDKFVEKELDEVFYDEEKTIWFNRLLISALLLLTEGKETDAAKIFSLHSDEHYKKELLKFIMRKSIYEYYVMLRHSDKGMFSEHVIEDIIKHIEKKWVDSDV